MRIHRLVVVIIWLAVSGLPGFSTEPDGHRIARSAAQSGIWLEFEPLNIDGFFNIINRGITRMYGELNGRRFLLTTVAAEVPRGDFVYLIPAQDTVLIDIFAYLNPGLFEPTLLRILPQGPSGATADLIIGDASAMLKDEVDFALELDPAAEGDANGDGRTHEGEDQFVELANSSDQPQDIGGWRLESELGGTWHVFDAATVLQPGMLLVVFGGGSPQGIPGTVLLANKPGGFGLDFGFGSRGDVVRLLDVFGGTADSLLYQFAQDPAQSLTRSPDGSGPFRLHLEAAGSGRRMFSPGAPAGESLGTSAGGRVVINEVNSDPARDRSQFPGSITLFQNAPNPFNNRTRIRFGVPAERIFGAAVRLEIYNLLGQRVRLLLDEKLFPGTFERFWDASDEQGHRVASGVYLLSLDIDGIRKQRKIMLLR